ncbi:MAG: hypothetical protein Q9165_003013 [Trypethelium subeluteriae]
MASLIANDPLLVSRAAAVLRHICQVTEPDDWLFLGVLSVLFYLSVKSGLLWEKPDPYRYKNFERPQESLQGTFASSSASRDIAERLEQDGADVVIFFGSQSGTAEGLADQLRRELQQHFRLRSLVADLSEYEYDTFVSIPSSKLAIFLMSTYGEGDPSDNATAFLNWLKSQSGKPLCNLSYAGFGLGNSRYKYYNAVIDSTVAALDVAGASLCIPVGKGDEAEKTTKEDFASWKESLRMWFVREKGLQEYDPVYEPSVVVSENDVQLSSRLDNPMPLKARKGHTSIEELPIVGANDLVSSNDDGKSCLHIDIDLSSKSLLKYKTGDHIALWPINPDDEVTRLIGILGLETKKDMPISIRSLENSGSLRVPSPTTVHSLFRHHLEICSAVSRETTSSLAQFTPDPSLKSAIKDLTSNTEAYASYVSNHYITLGRLLQGLLVRASSSNQDPNLSSTWHAIPLSFIVESLSPLAPRYYSISSSPSISPWQLSITVSVNEATQVNNSPNPFAEYHHSEAPISFPGLTTTYLSTMPPPSKIFASIKRSTFKMPPPTVPLVLIAAGSGIAPFRAFIQERLHLRKLNHSLAPTVLFYGCRHPEIDFLYQKEFEAAADEHCNSSATEQTLVQVIPAFSRCPPAPKQYVQDLVEINAQKVATMLVDDDAALFICGSASMAREVGKVVDKAVAKRKGWGSEGEEIVNWRRGRKGARRSGVDNWPLAYGDSDQKSMQEFPVGIPLKLFGGHRGTRTIGGSKNASRACAAKRDSKLNQTINCGSAADSSILVTFGREQAFEELFSIRDTLKGCKEIQSKWTQAS